MPHRARQILNITRTIQVFTIGAQPATRVKHALTHAGRFVMRL